MCDEDDYSWNCSYTSTQAEQQTPFVEFAWSVQQLCKELWPTSFEEVSVERLNGGSFNRVVGLTITSSLAVPPDTRLTLSNSKLDGFDQSRPETIGSELVATKACQEQNNKYILRLPRHPDSQIDGDIITLCYVRSRSSIPVPEIVAFDLDMNNPFGSPYSLQRRIPGIPLISIFPDLNQNQCRDLAIQLGKIIRELQEMRSPVAGELGFLKGEDPHFECNDQCERKVGDYYDKDTLEEKLVIMMSFNKHSPDVSKSDTHTTSESDDESDDDSKDTPDPKFLHYTRVSERDPYNGIVNHFKMHKEESALGCIQAQLMRGMMDDLMRPGGSSFNSKYYTRLLEIAREMDDLGYFHENSFNLFHRDLEARNIMVEIDDSGTLQITGILDWDEAKFVPRFVSCIPPRWLWCNRDVSDSDGFPECGGHEIPEDPDMRELKELFDQQVGEDFVRLAYQHQYCLARRLFRLSLQNLFGSWEFEWVDDLVKDWAEFRDNLQQADSPSESPRGNGVVAEPPSGRDSGCQGSRGAMSRLLDTGEIKRNSW